MSEPSVVPSNPEDRKKIAGVVKAISDAMTRAEGEKDYIKEAKKALKSNFGLASKDINRMVVDYHKNKFDERVAELDSYATLYMNIFNTNQDEEEE